MAVLTPELMTATRIAELAQVLGRKRKAVVERTLRRLELDGHAVRVMGWREARWRAADAITKAGEP